MRTSNPLIAAIGLFTGSALLHADVATFAATDGKLTGSLQAITKDGIIEWESPYSKQPLKLLADKLQQVEFSNSPKSAKPSPIQLTLRNGDILPANMVQGLEEAGLITDTAIAGTLTVPRAALASAQFGITERNVIYSGFDNIRDWTTNKGEPDNWKRRGNALVSSGRSIAARDFDMPENFVMNFQLTWDNRSPNYSVGFADPLLKNDSKQPHYRFNFDSSGMRILRQVKGEARARTLAQWPRRPTEFSDKKVNIELRVDRSKRQIILLINGEPEAPVVDHLDDIPAASGISFTCQTSSGGSQSIGGLTVTELRDSRTRHLAEKRGDASLDCIITTDDDRWSGELVSLTGTPEEQIMVFKTKFSEEAWEIPEQEVSTLFFANNPFKEGPGGKPKFTIEFHGKGKLTANSLTIIEEEIEVIHPLLGTLQIERSAVKTIRSIGK